MLKGKAGWRMWERGVGEMEAKAEGLQWTHVAVWYAQSWEPRAGSMLQRKASDTNAEVYRERERSVKKLQRSYSPKVIDLFVKGCRDEYRENIY
jgi:hypothetical protein